MEMKELYTRPGVIRGNMVYENSKRRSYYKRNWQETAPSVQVFSKKGGYKATNYNVLVSRPSETKKSVRAGGYYYYF